MKKQCNKHNKRAATWHKGSVANVKFTRSTFTLRVLKVVHAIPRGKVLSYQQVALKAGNPKAYRAVGNILNKNYDPQIPCHRVVRADGSPGGYNRGPKQKIRLLKQEKALL